MLDFAWPLALLALPLPLAVWWLVPPRRETTPALRLPFFAQVTRGLDPGPGAVALPPGMAGQNTVLGDAVGLAIQSLAASHVDQRVMILLSDGSDTASRMAPAKAAAIAAQNGVTLHTIAVGDPEAAAEDKVDIATLQAMASATGGSFHRAEDATTLGEIYDSIDRLHPVRARAVSWRPRHPLSQWTAGAFVALVLLAYALALLRPVALRREERGVA